MKALWTYMISVFSNNGKYAKGIKKSEKLNQYEEVIDALFKEQDILESYEENLSFKGL